MPQRLEELPDWFDLAEYNVVGQFDERDWYVALAIRREFHEDFENRSTNGQWPGLDKPSGKAFIDNFVQVSRPGSLAPADAGVDTPSSEDPQRFGSFEEIPIGALIRQDFGVHLARWEMSFLNKRLLIVDLDAPNEILKRKFGNWLDKSRENWPLAVRRQGPGSSHIKITKNHLHAWKNHRVLCCFDLDFYARLKGFDPMSHEKLCDTINLGFTGNPKKWGIRARRSAKTAMQSIDTLALQLRGTPK